MKRCVYITFRRLDDAQITAKSVEISKCLSGTSPSLVGYDFGETLTTGDAARLAVSIRNRGDEITRDKLAAISTALKIDIRVVEGKILPLYESFNWVDIKRSGTKVSGISENIPPTSDILATLGKEWWQSNYSVIEEASLISLSELSKRPFSKEGLISELDIKEQEFETLFDYGDQAGYIGKFASERENKDVIWTPLYWATRSKDVINFLQKQTEPEFSTIGSLTKKLLKHPGTPTEFIEKKYLPTVDSGIAHGIFPSNQVTDRRNITYTYAFAATPQFEVDVNSDLFEKARAIVTCIRHGQYHAEVSKIRYPQAILSALRHNTMKPHPYADIQYAVLVLHGIVTLEPVDVSYGKAFKVNWLDTPENNLAGDMANQLLGGEEIDGVTKEALESKNILVEGMLSYSSEQRRIKISKRIVAHKEHQRLMELISGVKF